MAPKLVPCKKDALCEWHLGDKSELLCAYHLERFPRCPIEGCEKRRLSTLCVVHLNRKRRGWAYPYNESPHESPVGVIETSRLEEILGTWLRGAQGRTQAQIAAMSGVSSRTVYRIFAKNHLRPEKVTLGVVDKLLSGLGLEHEWHLTLAEC